MNKNIGIMAMLVILVALTVPSNASVIGDTVTVYRDSFGSTVTGPFTYEVLAGNADAKSLTTNIPPNLLVDVEASSILIDFFPPFSGGGEASHLLYVTDIDWVGDPSAFISGVNFTTDISNFTLSDISFSSHNVTIKLGDISPGINLTVPKYLDINLEFSGTNPVPEPSTFLLLGAGLGGLALLRRRSHS